MIAYWLWWLIISLVVNVFLFYFLKKFGSAKSKNYIYCNSYKINKECKIDIPNKNVWISIHVKIAKWMRKWLRNPRHRDGEKLKTDTLPIKEIDKLSNPWKWIHESRGLSSSLTRVIKMVGGIQVKEPGEELSLYII